MVLDFGLINSGLFNTSDAAGEGLGADASSQILWTEKAVGIGVEDVNVVTQAHPTAPYTAWGEIARFTLDIEGTESSILIAWHLLTTLKDTGDISDTAHYRLRIITNAGDYIKELGSNGSTGGAGTPKDIEFAGTQLDDTGILAAGFPTSVVILIEAYMTGDGSYAANQMGLTSTTFRSWFLK